MGNFIICKASAGSGKTFTLVKQFLLIALNSSNDNQLEQQFKHILAITFTNKAANEMKARILSVMQEITLDADKSDMAKELCKALTIDSHELTRRTKIVQSAILHNYTQLSVCTIDSFNAHLTKTFARDLNLPDSFDVSLDTDKAIEDALDELMDHIGEKGEDDLTEILCAFADHKMSEGKSFMVDKDLKGIAQELFKEKAYEYLDSIKNFSIKDIIALFKSYREKNQKVEESISQWAQKALSLCDSNGLTADDLAGKSTGIYKYFSNCYHKKTDPPTKTMAGYFAPEHTHHSPKCPKDKQQLIESLWPDLSECYDEIQEILKNELTRYNTRNALLKNLYPLALLTRLNTIVNDLSHKNETIHISEFNKAIAAVVQNEPVPFIYERIGNRYKHILIDEFQDTSKMQWQNLIPLVEDNLSQGGTSMVVGDSKQAIYRFREGDAQQFIQLPHIDNSKHYKIFEAPGVAQSLKLDTSYRSKSVIVDFNNSLYKSITRDAENELLKKSYIGGDPDKPELEQKYLEKNKGGYVQVGFWDAGNKQEAESIIKEQIYHTIEHQVLEKGYYFSDITIIARRNAILNNIALYLSEHNPARKIESVPVVSSESFIITNSRAVRLIHAVLTHLTNKHDKQTAALVIEFMQQLNLINNDLLPQFAQNHDIDLEASLASVGYTLPCDRLRAMPLYDCCEEIIRCLKLQDIDTAYCTTFLGTVLEYCKNHDGDIGQFIEWFDRQIISTNTTSDRDAVTLMTIHKSKGLESPIVIYALPAQKSPSKPLWVHINDTQLELPVGFVDKPAQGIETTFSDQINEELQMQEIDTINHHYVATTRPCEKLFIFCVSQPRQSDDYIASLKTHVKHLEELETPPFTTTHEEEADGGVRYHMGEDQQATEKSHKSKPSSHIVHYTSNNFPNWNGMIQIATPTADHQAEPPNEQRDFGIETHDLLSHIHTTNDIDKAFEDYLSQNECDENTLTKLREHVERLMSNPDCLRFFDPKYSSRTECELLYNGKTHRPDRIVFADDELWVVDFKTGAEDQAYTKQIDRYRQALSSIGYKKIRGFLLYTSTGTVVEC